MSIPGSRLPPSAVPSPQRHYVTEGQSHIGAHNLFFQGGGVGSMVLCGLGVSVVNRMGASHSDEAGVNQR